MLNTISITLIAVDITVYAIGVPLFKSQLRTSFIYLTRRLQATRSHLKELSENSFNQRYKLEEVKEIINDYEKEEIDIVFKLNSMTLEEGVFTPCKYFMISLIIVSFYHFYYVIFINIYINILNFVVPIIAIFFIGKGLNKIKSTLESIEYASTLTLSPKFRVEYIDGKQTMTIKGGELQTIEIDITNEGDDIAEYVQVSMFIPPIIEIKESEDYETRFQPDINTYEYPKYTGIYTYYETIHVDTTETIEVVLQPQNINQTIKIPIYINEKKTTQNEFTLELRIESN